MNYIIEKRKQKNEWEGQQKKTEKRNSRHLGFKLAKNI